MRRPGPKLGCCTTKERKCIVLMPSAGAGHPCEMCGMLNADSLLNAYQPGDLLETCIQRISGLVTVLSGGIQLQPMASLSAQNLSAGEECLKI